MLDPTVARITNRLAADAIARTSASGPVTADRLLPEARHAVAWLGLRLFVPIPDTVVARSAAGYWDALAAWLTEHTQ